MDYSLTPPTVREFAALRAGTGWNPVEPDQLAAEGRAPFYERHGFARRPDDAPGMDLVR